MAGTVTARPRVSVLMPAYGQAEFIPRALASLLAQDVRDWELVVIDDGSPDDVHAALGAVAGDERVRLRRRACSGGLGAALNEGLSAARAPVVAYLPCDDLMLTGHLAALLAILDADAGVVAAVAAHDGEQDPILQLVQVAHRSTADRWLERHVLESDDLGMLFWNLLRSRGRFAHTATTTCRWSAHAGQRHRAIRESCDGGLNVFRKRYGIRQPLRFHSSETGLADEVARYAADRARRPSGKSADGLRVVLAGELAYNPERVIALEEHGHRLFGLWIDDPLGFNTVGPLPFGGVEDLDPRFPRAELRRVGADVVYALLNAVGAALAPPGPRP
jgi:glycosyltransferase involved in cell wall biosynthesis